MKLQRLRVENFKKFRQPYEISGLDSGLNLFVAPNETGKSTLTEAIKAAFFERSRSSSVEHLRPWGDSSAIPTVELDFEWDSVNYRLTKSFLGKKRCDLWINGSSLDGTEAEDHLAALLGFQYPGRGASSPEHRGIPGLLWIRQGSSHELNESVGHAGDHLRNALGSSVGEVTMNAGDRVIEALEAERAKLLTPSTNSPRADYQAAIRHQRELEEAAGALEQQINAYREGVDRLGRLQADHAEDERNRPWEALRQQLGRARESLEEARGLATVSEQARQQVAQSEIQVNALQAQADGMQAEVALLASRRLRLDHCIAGLESRQAVLNTAQGRLLQAQQAHAKAVEMLTISRAADRVHSARANSASLALQHQKLQQNLQKAVSLNEDMVALVAKCQNLKVEIKGLQKARKLQAEISTLKTRLESVATTLEFELPATCPVSLKGEALQGKVRLNLFSPTQFELPGAGRLTVLPGGADLAQWARQLEEREVELEKLLHSCAVTTVEELEAQLAQVEALRKQIESAEAVLAVLAPDGLDRLKADELHLQSQLSDLHAQLASLPADGPGLAALPLHEAELKEANARLALDAALEAAQTARVELSSAQAASIEVQSEHDALSQRLQSPEWAASRADVLQKLQEAMLRLQQATAEWQRLLAAVQALNLQVLEQDVKRLEQSASQAETTYQQRLQQISALEGELQARGALGQEEQLANLQTELTRITRRVGEFSNRAAALTLLLQLLREKRQELALKLQAPLQKHLQHYLNILWPGTQVELGEDLSIRRIQRNRTTGMEAGAFEELSMGAREQMGIVARLAYADLLKESRRPTLVVLDDALVHSDKERLAQMKRVLFDAATRHQILVFSCHPEDWSDLGVQRRQL